ncbi:bag of marbles [Haematobia irritans]|uniref:bag of marbles n=1 Tax=Haematobia irritans TaxID=7368 RepID=UPI003F50A5BB
MSIELHSAYGKDMLQINMDAITKELSDLVVNCETDFGKIQQNASNFSYPRGFVTNCRGPMQYGEENLQSRLSLSNRNQHNAAFSNSYAQYIPRTDDGFIQPNISAYLPAMLYPKPYGEGLVPSEMAPTFTTPTCNPRESHSNLPKLHLQYFRPRAGNGKVQSPPLISMVAKGDSVIRNNTVGGHFKKPKSYIPKSNGRIYSAEYDYSKINVDLSVMGYSTECKEPNQVLRLFSLFRDLQNCISAIATTQDMSSYSAYEPTFVPTSKAILPCTMNVQCQVKHSIGQIMGFIGSMQSIVNQCAVYDKKLAAECDSYLFKLRQTFAQFEMYKFLELEHKRGQFLTDSVRVHAEHLEKLMEHMKGQIRDVYIRIVAFDWYVGIKYRGENGQNKTKSDTANSTITKRSKIGVVNEILRLCEIDSVTNNIETETNKSEISSMTQENKKQLPVSCNVINSKNNEMPGAIGIGNITSIAGCMQKPTENHLNVHVRQPVFYIG